MSTRMPKMASCYCHAEQIGENFISKELEEFRRAVDQPAVLDLDSCNETALRDLGESSGAWDMIYSTRLLSRLRTPAARRVVKRAASRLKPGGRLLLANFSRDAQAQGCRICSHLGINFRTELDIAELTRSIPEPIFAGQAVFSDESKLNVYLELHVRTVCRSQASLPC